ncbi:MAG: hypothetical protein AVO33_09565 [delta proteobacterium ML8_F1]|nr:MAG: hypothetical protein AVO33_09565 [delta proteobacterium ML8_F1]
MKNFLVILLLLTLILTLATGCAEISPPAEATEPLVVTIAGLKGPTSMGMVQMIDQNLPVLKGYQPQYTAYGAPDELTGKIISQEIDIAAVPTNLASVLYHKTQGKVKLLGINTLGVIHLIGSEPLESLEDLSGKTLYISGKGATPDYAMHYLLESLGLDDEITLEFFPDHPSLAQAVIAKDAAYAVLPEPFVTQVLAASPEVELLVDLNTLWEEVTEGESLLSMGGVIVNTRFAEDHPEFVQAFVADYVDSVNFVNSNPLEAGALISAHGILPDPDLAALAIPNSAIVFEDAYGHRDAIHNFLNILYESNPSAVGGKLPDENFYYKP